MNVDILKIADLRFPGGTSTALEHELRALSEAGLRVGLLQRDAAALKQERPIHPRLAAAIERGWAQLAPSDADVIVAGVAVIHNPMILSGERRAAPTIRCERAVVVAHQAALANSGVPFYDLATTQRAATALLGHAPLWAPISPLSRANLERARRAQGESTITLAPCDWPNFLYVDEWRTPRAKPIGDRPVIGRHSRPDPAKWPDNRADLLAAYPNDPAFDVKLLGVGPALEETLGGPPPANWRCLPFGALDARAFLAEIDFFVYYHHPEWTEAFGRTVAEALASGCVAILPDHFRATFGEAALYRPIEDAAATAQDLWSDWPSYRLQSALGQRWVARKHGPQAYLRAFETITRAAPTTPMGALAARGERSTRAPRPVDAKPAERAAGPVPRRLDVLHVADMRSARESAWRIWNAVMIERDAGLESGLLHAPGRWRVDSPHINPHLERLRAEGAARAIEPGRDHAIATLAVVHGPDGLFALDGDGAAALPWVTARTVAVVHDRAMAAADIRAADHVLRLVFGGAAVVWHGVDAERRDELRAAEGVRVADAFWELSIWTAPWRDKPQTSRDRRPIVGRAGLADESQWPADDVARARAYPSDGSVLLRVLGWPHAKAAPKGAPDAVERFDLGEAHPLDFLRSLDSFHYFPDAKPSETPWHAMAMAAAHGAPVFLERRFDAVMGDVAIYANGADAIRRAHALAADPDRRREVAAERARRARDRFGPARHLARLKRVAGLEPKGARRGAAAKRRRKPVLFVSSNGVGLGHLTRLLAIARRMPSDVDPYFLTMSQAVRIVEQAGFPCLFTPFHAAAGCDPDAWNDWLRREMGALLDRLRPAALVFDGGSPYRGLLEAVAIRRDLPAIWVRRGMWRDFQDNAVAIARQKHFDLIVEPGEIAAERDRGATAAQGARALRLPPIRLLDDDEYLDGAAARARLGLAPDKPACLIQLGSGANRDIVSMTDAALNAARAHGDTQCVIAEWLIGQANLDLWPGVARLRGFPISKYFKAFDFTVAAAGYNSFNEIISMGLPAIFLANEHASMDDQAGRAQFAQSHDAAFYLPEDRPDAIGPLMAALAQRSTRELIAANCRRIAQSNGAAEAAAAIAEVAREAA